MMLQRYLNYTKHGHLIPSIPLHEMDVGCPGMRVGNSILFDSALLMGFVNNGILEMQICLRLETNGQKG